MTRSAESFPVFERHLGVWEGTYTLVDAATGEILDRHRSRLTCRRSGDDWQQRNEYTWPGGKTEVKEFGGSFANGRSLVFDTPRLVGEAWEVDADTIVLRWVYTHAPDEKYSELISLESDDHRARVWQHFEDGKLAKLTVIDERRVG